MPRSRTSKRDRPKPNAELTRLEARSRARPINAITLQGLERDYENIRVQYDSAVARLARPRPASGSS
jgi:hypothetical protein